MAGECTADRAGDCRGRVAASAANLVSQYAADDTARDQTEPGALAFFLDEIDAIDDAARRARASRLGERCLRRCAEQDCERLPGLAMREPLARR